MLRLRSTHFPGSGRRLLGRSKNKRTSTLHRSGLIQFCLSQFSAPVSSFWGSNQTKKNLMNKVVGHDFSTPWASRPLHRDAHLARSCCARVRGGHRLADNHSTLQDPYALLTFRIGPERRWVNRLPRCSQYSRDRRYARPPRRTSARWSRPRPKRRSTELWAWTRPGLIHIRLL
jgi:hypothetical protein